MNRRSTLTLTTITLLCLAVALPINNAAAQQKQQVSFSTAAENTKYTDKSEVLELGDVPNHILRVFEIHRTYPNNAPLINGTKIVESWTRGIGDRTDGIGPIIQYNVYVMENGDKVFARMDGIIENGSEKGTATVLGRITSGTGKFAAIQGVVREVAKFEIKSGFNENQTNIEYSIGK
jgi:hypothetical protein